jgi:hypothetical protein
MVVKGFLKRTECWERIVSSIFHHGATAQQQKSVYQLEPQSTNNNTAIHPDKEDQIPTTAVFTWGTIVGHDLAASEVAVLVATQQGPQ